MITLTMQERHLQGSHRDVREEVAGQRERDHLRGVPEEHRHRRQRQRIKARCHMRLFSV